MINSRFSQDIKFSVSSKNEIIKREFERFKKMIKNKTFVNSRSFRRDFEDVETTSIFFRFVVDSKSFIISAFFITFTSTSFVIIVSTSFATFVSIFFVTFFLVSAFFHESTQDLIFEEMNRNILITPRNGSIRFDFGSIFATPVSNRQGTEPKSVRFDLVRSLAGSEPKT
jgi:hypothetical protein